ncbi:MAG: hypothetical protein JXR60_00885 [Bacteroidales bacterium]|nr:hypothetical protein [Bacteroidales bacterium]
MKASKFTASMTALKEDLSQGQTYLFKFNETTIGKGSFILDSGTVIKIGATAKGTVTLTESIDISEGQKFEMGTPDGGGNWSGGRVDGEGLLIDIIAE